MAPSFRLLAIALLVGFVPGMLAAPASRAEETGGGVAVASGVGSGVPLSQ
jgi:hypothetical protein